jgi:outer membrane receptor protein involved in Fe transport
VPAEEGSVRNVGNKIRLNAQLIDARADPAKLSAKSTITLGINNVFDERPPFVAASGGDNYDQINANIKGRFWYVALKKRF